MLRKILHSTLGAAIMVLGLAACDQMLGGETDAQRTAREAEWQANMLIRGNAALEACIASQCKVLNIDGMRLEDFTVLNGLTHVTVLMASRTNFDNLNDISEMRQLKELHITSTSVADLTGLDHFPRLKVLHVDGLDPSVDISPVAQLTGLTDLAIGVLNVDDDASFIQRMRRLENLVIYWQGEADISVLRGHPSLRNVDILGVLPDDQSALLTMPKLKAIMIDNAYSLDPDIREELERRGVYEEDLTVIVC